MLGGLPVIPSLHATAVGDEPVRMHRSGRRNRGCYHRRIQKKWKKKYGCKRTPAAYLAGPMPGIPTQVLIVHPDILKQLKQETDRGPLPSPVSARNSREPTSPILTGDPRTLLGHRLYGA